MKKLILIAVVLMVGVGLMAEYDLSAEAVDLANKRLEYWGGKLNIAYEDVENLPATIVFSESVVKEWEITWRDGVIDVNFKDCKPTKAAKDFFEKFLKQYIEANYEIIPKEKKK